MKKGRAGTMTHDYKRHGTTTLFAALNVLDGTVIGRNMQRHRHQEFIRFLNALEREVPAGQGGPRDPRQLRRPQAPQGPALAGPAPALDLPLHADLVLVAQRRRGLLRQAQPSGASSAACSAPSSTSRPPSTACSFGTSPEAYHSLSRSLTEGVVATTCSVEHVG